MAVPDGLPLGLPRTTEQRQRNLANAQPGLAYGRDASLRPVPGGGTARMVAGSSFAVVIHGDDATVERPIVDLVYWVGAATPANGEDYDFWYVGTVL